MLPISANMANTATIFISTLHDEGDLFGMLMCQPLPNGEMAVDVIRYQNTVCQRCMKRGKEACKHAASQMPPWMSKDKQQRIAAFASERTRAEFEGTLHSKNQCAFDQKRVTYMFETKFKLEPGMQPNYIAMGIDPNAGGSSNSSIVSVYIDRASGHMVIKGYEDKNTRSLEDILEIVDHQIRAIRRDFSNIPIMICIETNVGFVHQQIHKYIRLNRELSENTFFIYEDKRKSRDQPEIGLVPTHDMKELLYELVKQNLRTGIVFDEDLIYPLPSGNTDVNDIVYQKKCQLDLRRQMTDYSIHTKVTVQGKVNRYIHGKHGGRNDDFVIGLQNAFAAVHFVECQPRYRSFIY